MLHGAIALGYPGDDIVVGGHGGFEGAGVIGVLVLVVGDLLIVGRLQVLVGQLGDLGLYGLLQQVVVGLVQLGIVEHVLGIAVLVHVVLGLTDLDIALALGLGKEGVIGVLVVLIGGLLNLGQLVLGQGQAALLQLLGHGHSLDRGFHRLFLDVVDHVVGHVHAEHAVHLRIIGIHGCKATQHIALGDGAAVVFRHDGRVILVKLGEVLVQLHHRVNADQIAAGERQCQHHKQAGQLYDRMSHLNLPLNPG